MPCSATPLSQSALYPPTGSRAFSHASAGPAWATGNTQGKRRNLCPLADDAFEVALAPRVS
jgi:hypothetical protein